MIEGISSVTIILSVDITMRPNPDIIINKITFATDHGVDYIERVHALVDMLIGEIL